VIHRALLIAAWACCALLVASFAMFARDQIAGASKHQQQEITSSITTTPAVPKESAHHAQPRQFIDDAARVLTTPFRSIVQTDSQWVLHGLPTIFALLAYGVGIGYLARYSRGLS
jgi:hypothetical protein